MFQLGGDSIFPLPLPVDHEGQRCIEDLGGGGDTIFQLDVLFFFSPGKLPPTRLLDEIRRSLVLLDSWGVLEFKEFDPDDFFRQRWINSYGEEVHVSKSVRWENIACLRKGWQEFCPPQMCA